MIVVENVYVGTMCGGGGKLPTVCVHVSHYNATATLTFIISGDWYWTTLEENGYT